MDDKTTKIMIKESIREYINRYKRGLITGNETISRIMGYMECVKKFNLLKEYEVAKIINESCKEIMDN